MHRLRRYIDPLRRTPLHPQWLLGGSTSILREVRSASTGRVLDIGCADRWIEQHLSDHCEYIGLDYYATGKLMYGATPDLFGSASRLPIRDTSVDTVLLLEVLEHLRDPREALCEIHRVLRPNGRLLLSVPFLYPIHDAPHDYQRYTIHGLQREMESAGLVIDRITPNLGSAQTAGLIACLAAGGMAMTAVRKRSPACLLVPLLVLAIPVINITAWLAGALLPSWPALNAGYTVLARKASSSERQALTWDQACPGGLRRAPPIQTHT